ncbi:MAG TPA: c-type cytochrome [Polyangiaceae bacterium]
MSRGASIYLEQACGSCHGDNAAGAQGPNITFSSTAGIGRWSYQQFRDSLRLARRPDGTELCALAAPYPETDLSEREILDLYAFLMSKPIVNVVNRGTYCP